MSIEYYPLDWFEELDYRAKEAAQEAGEQALIDLDEQGENDSSVISETILAAAKAASVAVYDEAARREICSRGRSPNAYFRAFLIHCSEHGSSVAREYLEDNDK